MAVPVIQSAFTVGEVAPSLFGRYDLARLHIAASTFRNGFVSYRGGYYSRAGTKFVGFSKQTGRSYPPRMITFQFSINQGLALEFGHQYMRVISNGAYVLDDAQTITNITNANPAVVTFASAVGAATAAPNVGAVTQSYVQGERVTLAGGTFSAPAVVAVTNTQLISALVNFAGTGVYAPGDTINITGGVQSVAAQLTVTHTQVTSATVAAGGAGGTNGTQTVTGTTGTGTKFQARVTVAANAITAVLSISVAGDYTANPTVAAAEPVAGAGLAGAQLNVSMGVLTAAVTTPGTFTANSPGGVFTQSATSGAGAAATFDGGIFAPNACTIFDAGVYTVFPADPVAQQSTTGIGLGVTFNMTTAVVSAFSNGDWIYLTGVNGMTEVNGETYVVAGATATTVQLQDVYGNNIDSSAFGVYINGGTAAKLFTLATPWNEQDLTYLKETQSVDVMSICCVNQKTGVDYQPYDLARITDNYWTLTAMVPAPTVLPPAVASATPSAEGAVDYQYEVTAVNPDDGTESVASPIANSPASVNIASTAGSITVTWTAVAGVGSYNIYKAEPAVGTAVPAGSLFGFLGTSLGTSFVDSNIVSDFAQVPPVFKNPFVGSGNYPGAVAYFQERRSYAATLNLPDSYFMSQPGAFKNFDSRIPSIPSDAIIGSPWSVQVNGIQFMVPMPGGLVVLTGLSAWQLTGTGGSSLNPQPIAPSTQQAQPQAYNGCSATVAPIKIDYDILYVQAKGSTVRDLAYQFYTNIYTGTDLTLNSSHLFTNFTIKEWAWCEEPFKVLWAVRDDGILLALTFLKPQEVVGWGRSDTNGFFESVCAVTEPPVDALYVATQRFPGTHTAYMIERMDNRLWQQVEDAWCVDCALSLAQPAPNATLTASSAVGLGACTGVTGLVGGENWSPGTTAAVVDAPMIPNTPGGPGAGAVPTLTIVGGVITAIAFAVGNKGTGYLNPQLVFTDPANAGSGASATITLDNTMTFTASAAVFAGGDVGKIIRSGGGIAQVTVYNSTTNVSAVILSPIVELIPNSGGRVTPQASGDWTMTTPVTTITGLQHLIGATVTGLADGNVIPPTVVSATGTITLGTPASSVTIGLGFQAQLQSLYIDAGEPTIQGQRKKVAAVTARIEASRGLKVGTSQPDGSVQSPPQIATQWTGLADVPDDGPNFPLKPYNALATPLRTGDIRIAPGGGFNTRGQVCIQQDYPLPMQVLDFVNELFGGDTPQTQAPKRPERGK